jgi:hypothetical protein
MFVSNHPDGFSFSPSLHKMLKGKSCFPFNKIPQVFKEARKGMVNTSLKIYKDTGLI